MCKKDCSEAVEASLFEHQALVDYKGDEKPEKELVSRPRRMNEKK
jgi:hypothetical protein